MAHLYWEEYSKNAFTPLYERGPEEMRQADKDESVIRKELRTYTHLDAILFAATSWNWSQNQNNNDFLPNRKEGDCLQTFESQQGIRAYYRVICQKRKKYILIACHVNVHGYHRGDLRFVEVNEKTVTRGVEKFNVIGLLFPGDIVAVTELSRRKSKIVGDFSNFTIHSECTWEVRKMTVIDSGRTMKDVLFSVLENKTAVVKNHVETMRIVEKRKLEMDIMYCGRAFVPEKIETNFTEDYHSDDYVKLLALSSKIISYPQSLGTIFEYLESDKYTRLLEIGRGALDGSQFLERNPETCKIIETCVLMGSAAANIVQNARLDERVFQMTNIIRKDLIVRFSIPNPSERQTVGLWCERTRIVMRNTQGIELNGIIETVVLDDRNASLQIVARISEDVDFSNTWIVNQNNSRHSLLLRDGFFTSLHPSSNGRRIIEALYGGQRIRIENVVHQEEFIFPSDPPIPLDSYQNVYVSRILSDIPIILGNSPFGCGKSMTIVTAALEIHRRYKLTNKQQLLVTQSNNAGTSLIDIILKIPKNDVKFVRYISNENWDLLPYSSRTSLDTPLLMRALFIEWATENLMNSILTDSLDIKMKRAITKYLVQERYIESNDLEGEARLIYSQMSDLSREEKPSPRVLRKAFFILYDPDAIVTTADSLPGLISVLKPISTIQIDEASQLPEHTLIYMLSMFPRSNFGLIGDVKQLPPHCEDILTGTLKEYAIGNTMERAIRQNLFPEAILLRVYRCHPVTTQLLSDIFYNSQLISGVSAMQRNEFLSTRSYIWPNSKFPILILNHREPGHLVGTSVTNISERDQVVRIVKLIRQRFNNYYLEETDIGIISFYRAQTSLLTEAFRGTEIKCGTIDSFQGIEKEVIILCCTNQKPSGFMKSANRINVAMSRARQATIIIGYVPLLNEANYWKEIICQARKEGCLVNNILNFGS